MVVKVSAAVPTYSSMKRGIKSSIDRVCIVENEEAAKAISGKIEWFASHGSVASGVITHANCQVLIIK
jgi:hypothetical protein